MDFLEKVLPLIFIGFWVLAALGRRKKEQRQAEGASKDKRRGPPPAAVREKRQDRPPPGRTFLQNLYAGLDGLAREISSGIEQDLKPVAGRELSGGAQRDSAGKSSGASDEDAAVAEILRPSPAVPSYRQYPPARSEVVKTQGPAFDIPQLRRAIIWSEILAPPVALRDE